MGHRVGFSKKPTPLGKPEDTLTWRRLLGRSGCKEQMRCEPHGYRYTARWKRREERGSSAAKADVPSVAPIARTRDKGSVTEEPCARKRASTVLKQRCE